VVAPPAPESEAGATTTGAVLAGTTEEDALVEIVDEEMPIEPVRYVVAPPPQLSVRRYTKDIVLDKGAAHSCEAETFHIDMSGRNSARAYIKLSKDIDTSYEMEIGGLPDGMDIRFEKTRTYLRHIESSEKVVGLDITSQERAQKGNFTVSVIYTQEGVTDSSVICQINIINQ
jgi:hypothetical protein